MPNPRHWETYSATNRPMQDGFYVCGRLRKDEHGNFYYPLFAEYRDNSWQTEHHEVVVCWPKPQQSIIDAMKSGYPDFPDCEYPSDALAIEHQAACRLADEYDAAQERGEVRTQADNQHVPSENKPTVADLGISRKDIFEARQVRDAERAERLN